MKQVNCHESYINYCVELANNFLGSYKSIGEIKEDEPKINVYEYLSHIDEPKDIAILEGLDGNDYSRAVETIMQGKFFAEHTAAGEATRLKLGTKYLINVPKHLTADVAAKAITEEKGKETTADDVINEAGYKPTDVMPLSLGTRHMLQYSFDIVKLAKKHGYDPQEVLQKQKMLVVLNEKTGEKIVDEFFENNFFGFKRENVMFMVQKAYHGIVPGSSGFVYDTSTPLRLHNHGHMVFQQTFDKEIFYMGSEKEKVYMSAEEYGDMLKGMDDKISYNIEDLSYLTGSIDFDSLAFALKKGDEGYAMLMEIVSNNPENPQKGGMAAYNKKLARNVMIEGFQLMGIKNHDITYLNKNFNHYPKPYKCWSKLKENGLNMPIDVKDNAIYFQPVQGDINFLVKTEFFQRKELQPIKAWKSPATTPLAIKYMGMQDQQEGFREYAEKILGINL
ncbi:MAG: hypothetical protein ACOCZQ_03435 [Nanoarchaeota archaeon]